MNIKSSILAVSVIVSCFSVQATESEQHVLTRTLLNENNLSYMIVSNSDVMRVITYNHINASEMCTFLTKNGINVEMVTNYGLRTKTGDESLTTISKC